ncbi:hypothetical protein NVV95_09045 [Herbiconiux sp. CPCC 205716]|uniref:Uncharacterized protein n=1 Tax=Herbiconiux gentiana TaxID=2970912 RepID=A0ABT2GEP1_9MICO|nr:hypothetical protein [Herbiconiux gentiana]MCS5714697.1 hypothetical protein [Herbiconiux gentiana]
MTSGADHHLRRLVEKAASLDEAVSRLGKRNSHELGLGITKKREYSTPTGKVKLPTYGPALSALSEAVCQPVQAFDEKNSQGCWGILLGAPGAVIQMPQLTSDELARQGLDVGATDISKLRQLALIAVIRPSREWDDSQALTQERLGGIGLLTLAPDDHGPGARMAWLRTRWANTTREFVSFLEPIYARAGYLDRPVKPRVAVVIDQNFAGGDPRTTINSLRATAAVCGLRVEGFVRDASTHQNVLNSLTKEPHGHLITLGSGAGMDAVQATFRKTPAGAVAGRISDVSENSPLESLRERFTKIAGVSAALQPVLEPPHGFLTMPITPVDCLHDGAFVYVRSSETDLWWTKDLDRHGGAVFKTYTKINNRLEFQADRDAQGDIVTKKRKGDTRRVIPLHTLNPCNRLATNTESHVRVPHPDA